MTERSTVVCVTEEKKNSVKDAAGEFVTPLIPPFTLSLLLFVLFMPSCPSDPFPFFFHVISADEVHEIKKKIE